TARLELKTDRWFDSRPRQSRPRQKTRSGGLARARRSLLGRSGLLRRRRLLLLGDNREPGRGRMLGPRLFGFAQAGLESGSEIDDRRLLRGRLFEHWHLAGRFLLDDLLHAEAVL